MKTKPGQSTAAEIARRFEEARAKEAERIANLAGTPKQRFTFKIEARLTVSKTVEVDAESQAHAEAVLNDEIERDEHFQVDDNESPWGCEDWKLKLLKTLDLPPPPKKINPNEPELPL